MKLGIVLVVLAGSLVLAPSANAGPLCEHRGGAHIERHGGKLEDDRFHLANGERVTCSDDRGSENKSSSGERAFERDNSKGHRWGRDNHKWWRND